MPWPSGAGSSARSRWPRPRPTRRSVAAGSPSPWSAPGPTGVELAGQIREVATKTLRAEFRHIKPEDARVLLFDGGAAPLAPFGPELSAKAARTLSKLGVEQHMHSIVTDVDATGLSVRDQDGTVTRYDAGTVLWTAGVAGAAGRGGHRGGHRRQAGPGRAHHGRRRPAPSPATRDLRDRGRDEPEQAPRGVRGGHAVRHLRRATASDTRSPGRCPAKPFRYRRPRLGRLPLPRPRGRLRWDACTCPASSAGSIWLFIHIGFLTGFRNRLGALVSWWPAFVRDVRRERTYTHRAGGTGTQCVRRAASLHRWRGASW